MFFALGMILYASAPSFGHAGSVLLFVAAFCVILTMYGGGFATVPAYLADMFGTQMVGAIHGRLLTAWSAAGVIGPVLINYFRDSQLAAGVPRNTVYDTTDVRAGRACSPSAWSAICWCSPVAAKWFMTDEQLAAERKRAHDVASDEYGRRRRRATAHSPSGLVYAAWLGVGIPILWGVWLTLQKVMVLFR